MGNSFTFYSLLALSGCLLAGIFFAWLLYGRSSVLTGRLRTILFIIRAGVLSLILWLLFSPLIRQISYTPEKPIVIIAQDDSQSAGTFVPPGFDSVRYKKDLQQLSKDLSEKYDVRTYSFSDHISKGLDFGYKGRLTNASALISQLNDEFMNRNVGAVILATDGIFNRGGNPAAAVTGLKAPVYTIAMGDTIPKKDVLIANINNSELVYLDNDFNMEVQLQAYQCDGGQTTLSVTEEGKKIHEEVIRLKGNQVSKNISVQLKASKLGIHRYTVNLSTIGNEISVKNNAQQVIAEVIDDRQKVLIAAAAPHPDLAALKEAITLNKHNDVSLVMNENLARTDPKNYGLIILYQLPGLSYDTRAFMDKVRTSKVSLWYIIGAQTNISQFNQSQNGVSLTAGNGALQYIYSDINPGLSVFDLDGTSRKIIENFDPLQVPSGQLKFFGDNQAVLNQRKGKLKTGIPQLFFMNVNGRKTGYLAGEGLWKWKLSEARESDQTGVFNSLIGQVVQYLSVKDDKRKFIVHAAKQTFDENEHILINAALYNDSYVAVNTPDVGIQLKDAQGKSYNFSFSKYGPAYQLDAGLLPPGEYNYTAATTLGGKKYTAKGSFFVNELIAEFQQTIADHQLLYHLSSQTNGKMYAPDQLAALKEELYKSGKLKTLSYEDRKYEELVNFKWLFILILLLLGTEWFLRKRNGAI
ncbi:MAG TPA: hypothetical protein VGC08_12015 [Pedobacter sp.]